MAYNVFKRPMFKRGGSTTGTGIMSHVEPRVKAANGFPTFGLSRQPSQAEIDAFKQANQQRIQDIRNQPSIFSSMLGPRFTDPNYQSPFQNFFSTNTGFGFMNFGIPSRGEGITANVQPKKVVAPAGTTGKSGVEIGLEGVDGITKYELDQIEKTNQAATVNAAEADLEKKGLLKTKPATKKEETYKGSDIKAEVEDEAKFLKELLKDEKYSKGELALLIAGAVNEPGGITAKLNKARELGLPIARKRREEDKAITLAAYKLAKEKEKYQERYSKDPDTIKYLKEQAKSFVGSPGYENMTEDQIYKSLLKEQSGTAQGRLKILQGGADTIYELRNKIINKENELKKPGTNERVKKALRDEIERAKSSLKFFTTLPEFDRYYGKEFRTELGLKDGGRVMKANGGDVMDEETDDMESNVSMTQPIGEGSGSQTVTEPVQKLSYKELRDRLPQEITDDVVNLLANSEEALQEFAYIRTQDDVNSFNTKYGVNLVIPPTRG